MAAISFATRTNFTTNAMKVQLEAIAAVRARDACETAAPTILQSIAAEAPQSKDGRHRSKSLSDPGSYGHDVSRQARGVRLNIHVMGDHNFKAKFFAINYGSGGHQIPGTPKLRFPGTNDRAGSTVVVKLVGHPGTSGTGFYERGIMRAIPLIPRLI
jgi:hypothetical protein